MTVAATEHVARASFRAPTPAVCKWPFDCFIQCGGSGLVIDEQKGDYTTAFFEAFPRNPDTFIRGEGKTVEEAERMAFAQLTRIQACPSHDFERDRFKNGCGICKHCGLFMSRVFEPIAKP